MSPEQWIAYQQEEAMRMDYANINFFLMLFLMSISLIMGHLLLEGKFRTPAKKRVVLFLGRFATVSLLVSGYMYFGIWMIPVESILPTFGVGFLSSFLISGLFVLLTPSH